LTPLRDFPGVESLFNGYLRLQIDRGFFETGNLLIKGEKYGRKKRDA